MDSEAQESSPGNMILRLFVILHVPVGHFWNRLTGLGFCVLPFTEKLAEHFRLLFLSKEHAQELYCVPFQK